MSEFKELNLPTEGSSGWYVSTVEGRTAWLTIHGDLTSLTDKMDILFFDTEQEAYSARADYYRNHHGSTGIEKECEQQIMIFE